MKIKDKKNILLKSLYAKRFDGKYYDVEEILIGGLGQTNRHEAYSIAQALADVGFLKIIATKDGTHAEITSKGVEYIEDLNTLIYEPNDPIEIEERETINSKLDEFSEKLKKIEVGQQITYDDLMDELETLKKLLNVLGKKDWKQMLKGKLVDAGFGTVTDKVFDLLIETFNDNKLLNG
ncbi:hypothetical protein [Peijinzhouia sedimentorum]